MADHDWKAIATLSRELAEASCADIDASVMRVLGSLERIVGGVGSYVVIGARRRPEVSDELDGWRVVQAVHHGIAREAADRRVEWYMSGLRYLADPCVQAITRSVGRPRAFLRREIIGEDAWQRSAAYQEVDRPAGVGSKLLIGLSLGPNVEIAFGVFRKDSDRPFDEAAREVGLAAVEMTGWFHARYARSLGYGRAHAPLTKRERETLLALLTDKQEKQIAADLGLTVRSLHQVVVAVYRKLGVTSRPELMAGMLGPLR